MAVRNKMPEENFFDALEMLSRERGIPVEELKDRIKKAIESAVKKDYDVDEEHIRVDMDTETGKFGVVIIKEVVEAFPEADDGGGGRISSAKAGDNDTSRSALHRKRHRNRA